MPFLDTNVFIDLRGRARGIRQSAAREAVARLTTSESPIVTSRFNVAELLVGVELSNDPVNERRKVDEVLENVLVVDFDEAAALRYAKFAAHLRRLGRTVGTMDLLIATVAAGTGLDIITRNAKHFEDLGGLTVHTY